MGPAYSGEEHHGVHLRPEVLEHHGVAVFSPWSLDGDLPASRGAPLVFGARPPGREGWISAGWGRISASPCGTPP